MLDKPKILLTTKSRKIFSIHAYILVQLEYYGKTKHGKIALIEFLFLFYLIKKKRFATKNKKRVLGFKIGQTKRMLNQNTIQHKS